MELHLANAIPLNIIINIITITINITTINIIIIHEHSVIKHQYRSHGCVLRVNQRVLMKWISRYISIEIQIQILL